MKKKEKEKENNQQIKTWSARSTFGFPSFNKISTICSYPFSATTKRGVLPFFIFNKN